MDIPFTPAKHLVRLMRARKLSATEVMQAFIAQVERANPKVNAIVTFLPEQALKEARALDRKKGPKPPLAGLPIAYKDLVNTRGIRTTLGSLVYEDNVPMEDALLVERLKAAGAITLGKTNTPEFGAGSNTFNKVFGATRNPYDLSRTAGGSSGGAAAAVASGMLPFADGSDLAASLRNPGNYCNVVGFRPTPGRVPTYPAVNAWDTQPVLGPIAHTVEDAAFLLSAMAGPDRRAPVSISEPGSLFARPLKRSFKKVRIAWTRDFGGLPVEPDVTTTLEKQRAVFKSLGCVVEEACPDFSGATEAFETLRAVSFAMRYAPLLETHRAELKDTVIWNIEQGLALDGAKIARAERLRTEVYQRLRAFLEKYEFLLGPVNQLPPFPVDTEYPTEIAGVKLFNYLDWMKSCYYITLASHPAISVPAGFTPGGLPVGLQIVGRYRDDVGVLQLAHAFEAETRVWQRRPPLAG
ncbi:MAG: amidase [Betaproteobacteria bacterium]|nr:amidase [Betaproteobacteria bacterium]MDH5220631.1 amidase [Betaproteobacteria bacterium]MDH5350549.1 amidase [Betaproteobacteria bacterium]